jgi:hypothetical protein
MTRYHLPGQIHAEAVSPREWAAPSFSLKCFVLDDDLPRLSTLLAQRKIMRLIVGQAQFCRLSIRQYVERLNL